VEHVREYDVVASLGLKNFVKAVNGFLKDGWQLHGEMTLGPGGHYLQAVVR
jgi:hypothetical protein